MQFLPIILATILGFATSVPVESGLKERIFNVAATRSEKIANINELLAINDISTRNSLIEDLIWSLVDTLRDLIVNGSGDIPVLDPLRLDELHLDGDLLDLPNTHVSVKQLVVSNLATFEIDRLVVTTVSIILQRHRIELGVHIPTLEVQAGNYDLSMEIFGGYIFGNGQLKLKIVNSRVSANLEVGLRLSGSGIFLTVRESTIRFNLDAFEAHITGLFGNEVASDFVSTFLSSLVPELLEFFEEDITNTLSSAVLEIANEILRDLDILDLLS